MRRLTSFLAACCFALVCGGVPGVACATETDQFTLPPKPLDDLGPDLAVMVLDVLRSELADLNTRTEASGRAAGKAEPDPADEREFVRRFYGQTGVGLPESTLERALRYGNFPGRNVRFGPSVADSIYAWAFAPFPLAHVLTDCPTIRVYGVDLGTDKIGHIFQQGYEYYTRYLDAREGGADDASATAGAVRYGVVTESTLFGITLTGVYSNGDLAGNYAGLKFYRNLFHEVRVGERTLAPVLRREGARWIIDPDRDNSDLLRPFVSAHLNEAFNPSRYYFSVERIRSNVRERCAGWFRQVPDFDEAGYRTQLELTRTWFGEPYGWDLPDDKAVTLLDCFTRNGRGPAAETDRRG